MEWLYVAMLAALHTSLCWLGYLIALFVVVQIEGVSHTASSVLD